MDEKASLSELARQHTGTALDALVRIAMTGQSDSAVVSAATAILDRAYARPIAMEKELPREDALGKLVREICERGSRMPIAKTIDR